MEKVRLGILISGRGSNMDALIAACRAADYPAEVAVVISNKTTAPGLEKAAKAGIPTLFLDPKVYPDRSEFEKALHVSLLNQQVDVVCLAGFMRILGAEFVENWTDRIVNIHPSLLPDYPGLTPQARALADGQSESGCTVHYVIPEMDAGPVILQKRVPILPGDTEDSLSERILAQEHVAYPEAVRLVAERLLNRTPRSA